jgi:hypothetical protein
VIEAIDRESELIGNTSWRRPGQSVVV